MMRKTLIPLAAALALSGCFSFGAKPPPQRMRLTPDTMLPAETSRTVGAGQAVTVMTPTVPKELGTMRVPVISGTNSVTSTDCDDMLA